MALKVSRLFALAVVDLRTTAPLMQVSALFLGYGTGPLLQIGEFAREPDAFWDCRVRLSMGQGRLHPR
jgi:hypothetical protein